MALGQCPFEGGGSLPILSRVCFEGPRERGGSGFFQIEMDARLVPRPEWRFVFDMKRNDRPCGHGVEDRNSKLLKVGVNGFLDEHCQLRKMSHSCGIGFGKSDLALIRRDRRDWHAVFLPGAEKKWKGIRGRAGLAIVLEAL